MLVAQDYVTRQKGVEVLRQQINNLWVSKVRYEYCAQLYRFMPHHMVVEEKGAHIKNIIRDLGLT